MVLCMDCHSSSLWLIIDYVFNSVTIVIRPYYFQHSISLLGLVEIPTRNFIVVLDHSDWTVLHLWAEPTGQWTGKSNLHIIIFVDIYIYVWQFLLACQCFNENQQPILYLHLIQCNFLVAKGTVKHHLSFCWKQCLKLFWEANLNVTLTDNFNSQ